MRRREFLTIGCAAASWPVVGHAQQQITPLVGVLCTGTAEALERYLASFREGMHELGYVEGSNIRFEFRFADGYLDRLPDLANELVPPLVGVLCTGTAEAPQSPRDRFHASSGQPRGAKSYKRDPNRHGLGCGSGGFRIGS